MWLFPDCTTPVNCCNFLVGLYNVLLCINKLLPQNKIILVKFNTILTFNFVFWHCISKCKSIYTFLWWLEKHYTINNPIVWNYNYNILIDQQIIEVTLLVEMLQLKQTKTNKQTKSHIQPLTPVPCVPFWNGCFMCIFQNGVPFPVFTEGKSEQLF
jgi:hypothetical protein